MTEKRRRFSPQFKAEAVWMVIGTGKPIAEVARDLGIHGGTLGNWVKAWRRAIVKTPWIKFFRRPSRRVVRRDGVR